MLHGLTQTFHFDEVQDLHSRFQALNAKINRSGAPYILKLANRLFGEKTYTFLQDYLTSTQKLYGSELSTVNFLNASEDARKQITSGLRNRLKKETKLVKMMSMKKKLPFQRIPEFRCCVLELPFEEKELSVIILLPDDIEDDSTGLKQFGLQNQQPSGLFSFAPNNIYDGSLNKVDSCGAFQ